MYYFNLIYDFVEGKLDPQNEEELFSALSSDDVLRNKMKNLYAIKDAAKNSVAGYKPSAKSTMAVFSALNIAPPEGIATKAPEKSRIDKAGAFFRSYRQGIIGGMLATFLLTCTFFMAFNSNSNNEDMTAQKAFAKNTSVPVVSSTENKGDISIAEKSIQQNNINLQNSNNVVNNSNNTAKNTKTYRRNRVNNKPLITVPKYNDIADNKDELQDNNAETVINKKVIFLATGQDHINHYNSLKALHNTNLSENLPGMYSEPLNIDFDGSMSWFRPTVELSTSAGNFYTNTELNDGNSLFNMNNASFTILHNFDDNFQAGLNVRREEFDKKINLQNMRIDDESNFTTLNAVGRFSFNLDDSQIRPYIQTSLGASLNGAMLLRPEVGVTYSLSDRFSIISGIEFNNLWSKFNGAYYYHSKFDLNLGMQVDL